MREILILLSLVTIIGCSSDDSSNNGRNLNNNGFYVNSVFYPTPEFEIGPIVENTDRGFDIYEFFFKKGSENLVHLDLNSPNLNELEEMTYPVINEDARDPGISLLRKNGFDFPAKDVEYYQNASENYKDGFIKVTRKKGKLFFEYEFNYFDDTKSISGSAAE